MLATNLSDLSFWEHWNELRTRFIRCFIVLILASCLGLFTAKYILRILTEPLARAMVHREKTSLRINVDKNGNLRIDEKVDLETQKELSKFRLDFVFESDGRTFSFGPDYRSNFYYFNPIDPFLLWLKASLIVGIILSLPYILFQFWAFIKSGLKKGEKRLIKPVILLAMILFPVGVAFAYFLLQFALGFFTRYTFPGLEPRLGIMRYLSFALTMMIASGLVFELPVIIILLSWMGLVNSRFLIKYRKHAIIILFLVSAFVTPPDIFTMFAIAIPLMVLYEISIFLAKVIEKKKGISNKESVEIS